MWIVVEGLDGSGKTSLLDQLEAHYLALGKSVLRIREPGGTAVGEAIRPLLKGGLFTSPVAELLGFSAARAELIATIVAPVLNDPHCVILQDRCGCSTTAYQGHGLNPELLPLINTVTEAAHAGHHPDIILFLDAPPALCLDRRAAATETDAIEARGLEFFDRVYAGYLEQLHTNPRMYRVDATRTEADVFRAAVNLLESL